MAHLRAHVLVAIATSIFSSLNTTAKVIENPFFSWPVTNATVAVGREAVLECIVQDLGNYKVAWLRVDTQTILTIDSHIITKNHRIGVTHTERRNWYLHIKEVRESDRGWYMCQINTDPMKSQVGHLDVVVPPDILDYETSTDMVVLEGSNVSLRCVAKGFPEPIIQWRREDGESIILENEQSTIVEGPTLSLSKVNRNQMGPYLCIASNGIPPSVSKRIMLVVQFSPMIWIQYQLVGAYDGQRVVLECNSEAYPRSINYWIRESGDIVPQNEKFEPVMTSNRYKLQMKLIINNIGVADYGIYKCISKNSLGETDGTINVYKIPKPHLQLRNKTRDILNVLYSNEFMNSNPSTLQNQTNSQFPEKRNSCPAQISSRTLPLIVLYATYISFNI